MRTRGAAAVTGMAPNIGRATIAIAPRVLKHDFEPRAARSRLIRKQDNKRCRQ